MRRKGISPLIAAVLLIAFTMSVAAMLTAWVTTFTEEKTSVVSNKSDQVFQCSYGGLSIYDAIYHSDDNTTDVTVANTGTYDFRNITIHIFDDTGGVVNKGYTGALNTADVKTITISTELSTKPARVRAISKNCPKVSDSLSGNEIAS